MLEPEEMVKPNAAISHRQRLDMSAWREKKAEGETAYRAWLNEKLIDILNMIENDESYEFDGEISTIKQKLALADFIWEKRNCCSVLLWAASGLQCR